MLPELWLRKTFPGTVFINTALPEQKVRTMKSKEQMAGLDDDSTEIFNSNMIERYSDRPDRNFMNGIYSEVENLCLAEFAAFYYKQYQTEDDRANDNQPVVLSDDLLENQHVDSGYRLPKKIKLMTKKETMKCRKVRAVVRFHTPSKTTESEKYCHHLLILYYPWHQESDLLGHDNKYSTKLEESSVRLIVQGNQSAFEPFSEAVDEAIQFINSNPQYSIYGERFDSFNEQENSDDQMEYVNSNQGQTSQDENLPTDDIFIPERNSSVSMLLPISSLTVPYEVTDDDLRATVRSLNMRQRYAFEIILKWCRDKVKNMSSLQPFPVNPVYKFISGGAGAGKSHLIKALYQTALKTFRYGPYDPELPTVLKIAPTGVAAININGLVINSALAIPKNVYGEHIASLPHERLSILQCKLKDLKLIIIDEISMVSNKMLKHIHERLKQIFGTPDSMLFAGISLITVGDLYQLPPIKAKHIFSEYKNDCFNICHPWSVFEMIELDQIMRQQGDDKFTELLNRVRIGSLTDEDCKILSERIVKKSDDNYPREAMHIWAENKPVDAHNKKCLTPLMESLLQ